MKKVILLFSLIMSVLFIACSKSSSDTAKQLTPEPIFTQEEVAYVNKFVTTPPSNISLISKNISQQNIDFTYDSTDKSGTKEKIKVVLEKKNSIYLLHVYSFENNTWINNNTNLDLSVERLLGDYPQNQLFTTTEAMNFKQKPTIAINIDSSIKVQISNNFSDSRGIIKYLTIAISKTTENRETLYEINIFKNKENFSALDSNGIIATEKSVDDILKNSAIKAKIESVINAQK